MSTNYITAQEYAEKFGYPVYKVREWCRNGQLNVTIGAIKEGGRWKIPANAPCPIPIKKENE